MRLRWTPIALEDWECLHEFISRDRHRAASGVVARIADAIEALVTHPEMGRKGRVSSTRELVVPPFVVVYRVRRETVEVLAIIHGARRWPDAF